MNDELITRLRDMADDTNRHKYDIGYYWNAVEEAADAIEQDKDLRARLNALADEWAASTYAECAAAIRALLLPAPAPSAPVPPKCEECVSGYVSPLHKKINAIYTDMCSHFNKKFNYCKNERSHLGVCGPAGWLFKKE